jgi:L-rhamnose mutarotase
LTDSSLRGVESYCAVWKFIKLKKGNALFYALYLYLDLAKYVGEIISDEFKSQGWKVSSTLTKSNKVKELQEKGINELFFNDSKSYVMEADC